MALRNVYLKIEPVFDYTPVRPDEHVSPPIVYMRDCMRNVGHEDGTIPADEVNARRLTALIYREYLDAHHSPRATAPEVISKILYLRQHYHFGAGRIAAYLTRFHRIRMAGSSVHRILRRHGMPRLPANQKHRPHGKRWQRYEKPQPGYRLQVDVKFLERIAGTQKRLYQFTAIDDCTRIRVLKVYDACNQRTAIQFIDEVVRRLPFRVHVVQTDNGAEFQSRFHWHVEALDMRHVYIRPRTPHLNGKVERSHRVDEQEFYQLLDQQGVSDDIHLFNEKLREWEDYYNYHRPHGALDGQTPYERLLAKTRAEVSPGS